VLASQDGLLLIKVLRFEFKIEKECISKLIMINERRDEINVGMITEFRMVAYVNKSNCQEWNISYLKLLQKF
jgi:hypothetical protein